MTTIPTTSFLRCVFYPALTAVALILVYAISGLVKLKVSQWSSHLGDLRSPAVPSFFWGHLQMLHDAENTNLYVHWMEQLGAIFTYRGFIGGYRLVTMDPAAITHILSRPHEYPKPSFVRDTLASMAGEQGLLVVEGETHRRQRNILARSFTAPQVHALMPIFYQKAQELHNIWISLIDTPPPSPCSSTEDESPFEPSPQAPSHRTILAPATPILPLMPPLSIPHRLPRELSDTGSIRYPGVRIDVLNWLGRATLDVIGVAGFGYSFHSLKGDRDDLAEAFAEVFSVARKFRFVMVLHAWFPILRYFDGHRKHMDRSLEKMRAIGLRLIHSAHKHLGLSQKPSDDVDFRAEVAEDEQTARVLDNNLAIKGRDLLSVLIKSNSKSSTKECMSQDEILSQISTFMATGHETTSSALTWALYALAKDPERQKKLRAELAHVQSAMPVPDTLNALPYLDMVVRESLRLHSPVSQTMRVATQDDVVPVSAEYLDKHGYSRREIRIRKGDIISIPIQAMNKNKLVFGEDAEKFVPERWKNLQDQNLMQTLYTFLQGERACIGYRFALLEMKVFLFILLRSVQFEICPGLVIEKRVNVVTRPLVKSEPERGNQMPLLLSRVPPTVLT